jgi:hypothetical protein
MKIVIVDSDPCSRAAIEQSLERHQCQQVLVIPPEALPKSPDALLWVKDAGDTPLSGASKLKDSDQFARPFRIGALLDRVNRYIFQSSKDVSPFYIARLKRKKSAFYGLTQTLDLTRRNLSKALIYNIWH